ncbi:MAG: hypothetical protein NTX52_11165 [Planctomycetota bacterium]|nr:hypothetical protein [Planctomycetota bacterium]
MPNVRMITKKQRAVIEDLFAGGASEQQVLARHRVSQRVYEKWQTDEFFLREFDFRLQRERRQSEMIIARYAAFAAAKLVQLTESENQETARKACLDILSMHASRESRPTRDDGRPTKDDGRSELNDETASRLLSALAEEKDA